MITTDLTAAATGRSTEPVPEHPWGDKKALLARAKRALVEQHGLQPPTPPGYWTRDAVIHELLIHGIAPEEQPS